MKRSNRLVLLIGIFLALIAFVLILVTINGGNGGGNDPRETDDHHAGRGHEGHRPRRHHPGRRRHDQRHRDHRLPAQRDQAASLVVGQIARQPVTSGQAITTDVLQGASGSIQNIQVPVGHVAMAVQVDQVTGVGTIIKAGDYVDIVNGITGTDKVPLVVSPTIRPGGGGGNATPAPRGGFAPEVLPYNPTTVKTLIQGVQVLGTLLPPPTSNSNGNAQASPGAGRRDDAQRPAADRGPRGHVAGRRGHQVRPDRRQHLAGPAVDRRLPALESPSPSPSASPSASPGPSLAPLSPCPVFPTTGVTLRKLVDDFGVLPPQVVEVIQPTPYPQFARKHASTAGPRPAPATRWAGSPPAHRRPIHLTSRPPVTETHGRPDPRPDRRRHPGDPRSPLEAPGLRERHRGRRLGRIRARGASRWRRSSRRTSS